MTEIDQKTLEYGAIALYGQFVKISDPEKLKDRWGKAPEKMKVYLRDEVKAVLLALAAIDHIRILGREKP